MPDRREAASQGAQIICLQELFVSRYFCQTEDTEHFHLAEPIPGPTSTVLGQLAAALQVVLIDPPESHKEGPVFLNILRHTDLPEAAALLAPAGANAAILKMQFTGVVLPGETVAAIVELAAAHGLWVLSDEVYDELVFEVDEAACDAVRDRIVDLMSNAATLSVALKVEAGIGRNWDEAH